MSIVSHKNKKQKRDIGLGSWLLLWFFWDAPPDEDGGGCSGCSEQLPGFMSSWKEKRKPSIYSLYNSLMKKNVREEIYFTLRVTCTLRASDV